jgi:Tfp pilus assembly protein PilV
MKKNEINRRRLISAAGSIGILPLAGCQATTQFDDQSTQQETTSAVGGEALSRAQFEFTYDGEGTLRIVYVSGPPLPAGNVRIRSSEEGTVRWGELGSTAKGPGDDLSPDDSAMLGADILNWPSDVDPSAEVIRVLYISEDGAPTTMARFERIPTTTPGAARTQTPSSTPTDTVVPTPSSTPTATPASADSPTQTPSPTPTDTPTETPSQAEDSTTESFEDGKPESYEENADFLNIADRGAEDTAQSLYADHYCGTQCHPDPLATYTPDILNGSPEVERLEFYWRETSDSYGGGVSLHSADTTVAGVAANNPEWMIFDPDRSGPERWRVEIYEGDGYERWVRTEFNFDWENMEVTYTFEDQESDSMASRTVDIPDVDGIDEVQFRSYSEINARDENPGIRNGSIDHWWDEIVIET